MTSPRRFEHELSEQLLDLYLEPAPSYRFDVLAQTSRLRQRPRWTFPERWLPMTLVRRRSWAPVLPMRPVLATIALLALLILAVLAFVAGGKPSLPPPFGLARNGEIVYSLDGDIYVRQTVDSPPRLLIGGATVDEAPWFSRRGDQFIWLRATAVDASYDLWVADADGSDQRRLGGPFTQVDTWDISPDGAFALMSSKGHDGRMQIELLPLDGSPTTVLPLPVQAIWPRFRPPDGKWISFRGGDPEGRGTMYLVHPDGSGLHPLALDIKGIGDVNDFTHGMDWSVDGSQFAFVSLSDTPQAGVDHGLRIAIATIDPAGQVASQQPIEFDPTADNELNPVFLPGTDKLLFNTREGIVDFVSIGVPGVPGRTIIKPGTTTQQGIDYALTPDATGALVLDRGRATTYYYDLRTLEGREVVLGRNDVTTIQRLAN